MLRLRNFFYRPPIPIDFPHFHTYNTLSLPVFTQQASSRVALPVGGAFLENPAMTRSVILRRVAFVLFLVVCGLVYSAKGAEMTVPPPQMVILEDPLGKLTEKFEKSSFLRNAALARARASLASARQLRNATNKVAIFFRRQFAESVEGILRIQNAKPEEIGSTQKELDELKSNRILRLSPPPQPPILKTG
jgi:hypothetical protein